MFKEDVRRIKACIEYKDYYSALQYGILIKDNYKDKERIYFEDIIKNIKTGNVK